MLTGVSKTALLTLRARADEHRRADRAYADPDAVAWLDALGWPAELDRWYDPRVQSFLALRALELDGLLARLVGDADDAVVVELGAGLSSRARRLGPPARGRWIDLDLPAVIAARERLGAGGARHRHLACSALDHGWFDAVGLEPGESTRLVLLAEGLLYYLPRAEVDGLFLALRARFPGAAVAFDVLGELDRETFERARAVGAPMAWLLEPPFERAWQAFGVEVVPGLEPERLLVEAVDLYWSRLDPQRHQALRLLAHVPGLAGARSGFVAGRLAPR